LTAPAFSFVPLPNRCILAELDEPIYLRLYSPEWEGGENYSNVLVVTLADYFQDLSTWLPPEYFKVRADVYLLPRGAGVYLCFGLCSCV
jgi:hypothetical protein